MKQITLERINEMKSYIVFCTCVTFLGLQVSPCPVGYHKTADGYCCLSVVCLKDHQFHLCTFDGGSDTCTPCDEGKINLDEIHTKEWPYEHDGLCRVPDCDCSVPDTVIDNLQECTESTGRPHCVCNRKNWYYGQDRFVCNLANNSLKMSAKEKGVELTQNGTVRPCQPGYFKSQYGGSICSPHSKCPQGFIVDIKGTAVQDTTCKRSLSSSVPTTSTSSSSEADQDSTARKSDLVIGLLIGLGAVIVVFIILGLTCWWKKRQKSADRINNNVDVPVDPEIGSKEPLIEEKEKKDLSASTEIQIQDGSGKAKDSIELEGSGLDLLSLLDSGPKSDLNSRLCPPSNLCSISFAQVDSFRGSLQNTSEDLGIGLSADTKNTNKIQKSGQTQGKEEMPVQGEY
ncbi:uncharacterized protein LOC128177855 isoform X1 [Crassostrea angulata]|uniref:uncharacterized protein LOC128177855 isoform X1 n=1 Tax=Magallana angulata TaxID=2784310 RepID=UPI0022B1361F|nr:uncharacterized protein LOC128177855 isoform X1 [Crassostrea angulata]